jgi:cell division protein FtsI/penicillin-binding protein 2
VSLNAAAQPVNITLQAALTRAMGAQRGAAVVLDVHSGRILASSHLDVAARRVAAPGSSIKPFTLLALLESGKVSAQTALVCKRMVSISGHKLDCSHPVTSEPLDPAAALAYSCNSYFTTVALRISPEELRNSFLRDGFASPTVLASSEARGVVALAGSPEQEQLQAIGEWGVKVTPLELATAYRSLALLQSKHEEKLSQLFAGLEQSVTYGMGHEAQPAQPMKVAGKTGTAPADEGTWTHAWFAGYAPAQDPEIVLVVFLEKGHGGSDAAAVARQVFDAFATSQGSKTAKARGAQP